MNNKIKLSLISIAAATLFLITGLSGCLSNNANVASEFIVHTESRVTMNDRWNDIGKGFVKEEYGFGLIRYVIIETFQNLENHPIDVKITANFYDKDNNFLDKEIAYAHGVQSGAEQKIPIYYYHQAGNHFYSVARVDILVENA